MQERRIILIEILKNRPGRLHTFKLGAVLARGLSPRSPQRLHALLTCKKQSDATEGVTKVVHQKQ